MVLVLIVLLALAAVSTVAASWLSRNRNRSSSDPGIARTDRVDRWLIQHLPIADRG
jgi:hypothetical protein